MSGRRVLGTLLLTGALAAAGAGCGETPEDNAHDHGEDVGEAFRALTDARSVPEIQDAAQQLKDAVAAVGDSGGDRVQEQLKTQQGNVEQAIAQVKSELTAGDAAGAQATLQSDLQDVRAQAQAFQSSNDSVANAFWDGVKDGYDDD
jgi:gas vesicle protein